MTTIDLAALDLPRLFTPALAAEILRGLGLTEMTECALRTRAYRRQVPFHLNGRRIAFTTDDLREIVEGQPRRPEPLASAEPPRPSTRPARRRAPRTAERSTGTWRARQRRDNPANSGM
jgi:hypothetical protein